MKRILLGAVLALAALTPTAQAQLPAGDFSNNVEFVKNVAGNFDAAGGRLVDGYFYVTTTRELRIYDVKDAENPVEVGSYSFAAPDQPQYAEEDPDTNGKILLYSSGTSGDLDIIDVSDKTAPKLLSTLTGGDQHTWTCVLDCTYAYGSYGMIADLRDPRNPKLVGDWSELHSDLERAHDVTEVSPGLILTATQPLALLDARTNPAAPTKLATGANDGRFNHQAQWPNGGTDPLLLTGGEAMGPACDGNESAVLTSWSTTGWEQSKTFTPLKTWTLPYGSPTSGSFPQSTWCTHWLAEHPSFSGGGLIAISWYEQGTHFIKVGADGSFTEVGYFTPLGGQGSQPIWITDRVAYIVDYTRGLDVVKFTGEIPAAPAPRVAPGNAVTSQPAAAPSSSAAPAAAPAKRKPSRAKCLKAAKKKKSKRARKAAKRKCMTRKYA